MHQRCSILRTLSTPHLPLSSDDRHRIQTPYNYHRALIWTAVMTALSHLDSAFGSVAAIEAINEPIMDANQTPGYGDCMSTTC